MSQIFSYAGSVLQSTQVQRQQSVQKDRQLRRLQELARNVALQDDQLEHSVESSEELSPIHEDRDQDHGGRRRQRQPRPPPTSPNRTSTSRRDTPGHGNRGFACPCSPPVSRASRLLA